MSITCWASVMTVSPSVTKFHQFYSEFGFRVRGHVVKTKCLAQGQLSTVAAAKDCCLYENHELFQTAAQKGLILHAHQHSYWTVSVPGYCPHLQHRQISAHYVLIILGLCTYDTIQLASSVCVWLLVYEVDFKSLCFLLFSHVGI